LSTYVFVFPEVSRRSKSVLPLETLPTKTPLVPRTNIPRPPDPVTRFGAGLDVVAVHDEAVVARSRDAVVHDDAEIVAECDVQPEADGMTDPVAAPELGAGAHGHEARVPRLDNEVVEQLVLAARREEAVELRLQDAIAAHEAGPAEQSTPLVAARSRGCPR